MTLYAFLEANQPTWREDLEKSILEAIKDIGTEKFIQAVCK